jgi:hypothetical protein
VGCRAAAAADDLYICCVDRIFTSGSSTQRDA